MPATIQVVIDCADPGRLAAFWAQALGYAIQPPPEGFVRWEDFLREMGVPEEHWNDRSAVVDPESVRPRVFFQRVPEPKVVKNRVHLDLSVSGGPSVALEDRRPRIEAEAARLVGLGASIRRRVEEQGEFWITMRDPEGNEFCVQ